MITSLNIGRRGNLCNSMFQLAAVIGMAKKTGFDIAIPYNKTYYEPSYGRNNTSIFDGFDITIPILDRNNLSFTDIEFPFHYEEQTVDDFTNMVGYFQSEKYFVEAKTEVANQFQFKKSVKDILSNKLDNKYYPDPDICTALHIRLGDYVHLRDSHPAQPNSYWQQAVRKAGLEKIIIFSDDIKTAKQIFGESTKLIYSTDNDPFVVLYHMSLCRNNIICNSTFGWWGAWLGEQNTKHEKIVIAPNLWFGPGHRNYDPKDIVPNRWLTI